MIGPAFNTVGIGEATVLFWVIGGALTCGLTGWAVVLVGISGTVPWRTVGAVLPVLVAVILGSEVLSQVGGRPGLQATLAALEESVHRKAEVKEIEEAPPSPLPWKKETAQRAVKPCPLMETANMTERARAYDEYIFGGLTPKRIRGFSFKKAAPRNAEPFVDTDRGTAEHPPPRRMGPLRPDLWPRAGDRVRGPRTSASK